MGPQINKLCINISSSRPGMCYQRAEYSRPVLSFVSLPPAPPPPIFLKAFCSCNSFPLDDFTGVTESDDKLITWQSKNGAARETQADSHVIIICLMMCGGANKERERY